MKFIKGQSGNPAGRTPGSKNKATALRAQLEKAGPLVIEKVIAAALGGDLSACRLVLERICPPLRPVDSPAPLAANGVPASSPSAAIANAAMTGAITPQVARTLAGALAGVARIRQMEDLESRVAALEDYHEQKQNGGTNQTPRIVVGN